MINISQYTERDKKLFFLVSMPFMIMINYLLFGKRYLLDGYTFLAATAVTSIIITLSWRAHIWVAVTLRNRFPRDRDMIRRLCLIIFLFVLMTWVTLAVIFWGYDYFRFLGYEFDENVYNGALAGSVVLNIFVSVVNESISSFEKWKTTLTETEQLKKEHMHSQLLGLKNQVSPHFLFNSLNSLSSLIIENPAEAERFLDEMSKVYRYLLRNNEEQVVDLGTELQFTSSYFHLLKARYGKGVELLVDIDEEYHGKMLPPLTLQILLDNILKLNLISKDKPLSIQIYMNDWGWLEIKNNVQRRISDTVLRDEQGIANISNKYRLLCQNSIQIVEAGKHRIMQVPLISPEQIVTHESI